jgi:retinol dehydrogenase-12
MSRLSYWKQAVRGFVPPKPAFTEKDYSDQTGRVFIVTGGCSGIGFKVSRFLAEKNAKVWIVARSEVKINEGIAKIKSEFPNARLEYFLVDFTDLKSIKSGVQKFLENETRLDVVIHNAGVMVPPLGSKSKDGYELQLSTNNLGPWLLQKYLDSLLIETAKQTPANSSRVIWVSSSAQFFKSPRNGGVNWDDINNEKSKSWMTIYGQSKAINVYQANLWPREHADSGVVSLSLDPGNVKKTELGRHFKRPRILKFILDLILYPAKYGAYTEMYAAISPDLTIANNGDYIVPWGYVGIARSDILKGIKSELADKVFDLLETATAKFL